MAKCANTGDAALDGEGAMLTYLSEKGGLPTPTVWLAEPDLLLMDHLEDDGRMTRAAEEEAATLLAALHQIEATQFGFEYETRIGPLPQSNPWEEDWITFFGQHRLLLMARAAYEEGQLEQTLLHDIETLIARLPEWMDSPSTPRLIHGDVWGGNVLVSKGHISGFIDPAIYYADPEIELAFISLFHCFGETFFHHYAQQHPINDGFWQCRKDLYNLYPLLVHVRLYEGGYMQQVETIVRRFVG